MKQQKNWTGLFLGTALVCLALVVGLTVSIDPYMHYRRPQLDRFRYEPKAEAERSINNGMVRHLDYDALLVGTSMMENTKTSLADSLFGCRSIKTVSIGASWWEISSLEALALEHNPELSLVVRGLDMTYFDEAPQALHYEIGPYPTYLYNDNPLDDVYYVLNRDVLYSNCLPMLLDAAEGVTPGLSNLDDYGAWKQEVYGPRAAMRRDTPYADAVQEKLSDQRRERVLYNVREKVLSLAEANPDTVFYYFLTPYSAAWWGDLRQAGQLEAQLEMEELVIRSILPCGNIRLYSWNTVEELTFDLANYKDRIHYGPWVNDWMLEKMASGEGLLTADNVEEYLSRERELFETFDYNTLFDQPEPAQYGAPEFFRQ